MATRKDVLRGLSVALKKGLPIVMSTYNPEPPTDSGDRLCDVTIQDILDRRNLDVPQIFSGDSSVLIFPDES